MFQLCACANAVLKVSFQVKYRVAIESELLQLLSVLETGYALKFLQSIVWEEDPLKAWTVLQAVDLVYKVTSKVQLCQGDEPVEVLYSSDEVVCEVQDTKLRQVIDVFYLSDLIRMKI